MAEFMLAPQVDEIFQVLSPVVSCDGGTDGRALEHPLIYLNMGDQGHIECPYCSRQFVLVESPF